MRKLRLAISCPSILAAGVKKTREKGLARPM